MVLFLHSYVNVYQRAHRRYLKIFSAINRLWDELGCFLIRIPRVCARNSSQNTPKIINNHQKSSQNISKIHLKHGQPASGSRARLLMRLSQGFRLGQDHRATVAVAQRRHAWRAVQRQNLNKEVNLPFGYD
jgi:hypothetical protein